MPINTDLNTAPYFDDFDVENQYHRVLFKPGYAVQARELTQLQTILQSQIEQFGDNIFKEGSVVKGCTFTNLNDLKFVRVSDNNTVEGWDPLSYISRRVIETVNEVETEYDYVYRLTGATSGLTAEIISAARGLETRPPDLNTFFIRYLTTNDPDAVTPIKAFQAGEELNITLYKYKVGELAFGETNPVATIPLPSATNSVDVTALAGVDPTGNSFGIQVSPGIIFQRGHFLYSEQQTLVVAKYTNRPDGVSVGFDVNENFINALQDDSLYDNANGSQNENAPGADRLKLTPVLTVFDTAVGNTESTFFALQRYENGNAVQLRDVSQYNVINETLARRTFEESGNYISKNFKLTTDRRNGDLKLIVDPGVAYVKGFRVENNAQREIDIDDVTGTKTNSNQPISFNYGGWVDIDAYAGTIGLGHNDVTLQNAGGAINIGTAFIVNVTPGRVYLGGIVMTGNYKFSEVERIFDPGNGYIQVSNATLKESTKSALVFDTGMRNLKSTTSNTIPVRKFQVVTPSISGGSPDTITLTPPVNSNFATDQDDLVVIDQSGIRLIPTSVSTAPNSIIIEIAEGTTSGDCRVYYNENLVNVLPHAKVERDTYIKFDFDSIKTKYNLGFPDVYQIVSVTNASGKDYSSSFRLVTNQKDAYYDLSYLEYIKGRDLPANGTLTVNLKAFEVITSSGEYYFTISSYPTNLAAGTIPVYEAENGSKKYNLRECFDFRPHADKLPAASYTANAITAPTINDLVGAQTLTFNNNGTPLTPAVNSFGTSDIEFYLGRVDVLVADSYGSIELIKGEEEEFPRPIKTDDDQLVIGEITVGYPALSQKEASEQGKRQYAVKAVQKGIKNYTMKDLHNLEKKIDKFAYYISLSQLEAETANLDIRDENGLSRFKNGFVAEPFNDFNLANIRDPGFTAAIHHKQKILTPSLQTFPINLKYAASSGVSLFPSSGTPEVATLERNNHIAVISQPYATNFRNCVSNFYNYSGTGQISPIYDAAYDTTTNPVVVDIDTTAVMEDFVDNMQEISPITDSTTTVTGDDPVTGGGVETVTTRSLEITGEEVTEQYVGDFVQNVQMNPYMAGKSIKVFMSGLRPNTRHYFYFDKIKVDQYVKPGILPGGPNATIGSIRPTGSAGDSVITDSEGTLSAVFDMPEGTFLVGERVLEIYDVDQYSSIKSASNSGGFIAYNAYNFSIQSSSVTVSTRTPTYGVSETTTTRNLPTREAPAPVQPVEPDPAPIIEPIIEPWFRIGDPLAQTFFIKNGMGRGSNCIYVSKIDLYFKRKSSTNGVNVMIREVQNGYPTAIILPFSNVNLRPSEVSVSDNASIATTVEFHAPVRLDVEKEYAVVIMPDANDPDYLAFTSKVGGNDLTPGATQGKAVVQDWGDGVLFTSTNNRAWQSYQDEDVKFTLYRHVFSQTSGTVTLTNKDNEFLTVEQNLGIFKQGEDVYTIYPLSGSTASSVSVATNSPIVTGTALSDTYAAGDWVLFTGGGGEKEFLKVASIDGATQMTMETPIWFQASVTAAPVVKGELSYYNFRSPSIIHLEDSTANAVRAFSGGQTIIGALSGATAVITSVDNIELSYFQPFISRANSTATKTTLSGEFVDPLDNLVTYTRNLKFSDNNYFNTKGAAIYSRSNDVTRSKKFELTVNMENKGNTITTPVVDVEVSKLIGYKFKSTNNPATTTRYIGKRIELASDSDADDLSVILTGYRPSTTDIRVYVKPQNVFDSDTFDSIPWIELEISEGKNQYCSSSNMNDYREFVYKVPDANKNAGVLTYTSNAGDFEGFRRFAIKIELLSDTSYIVPRVKDYRGIALS